MKTLTSGLHCYFCDLEVNNLDKLYTFWYYRNGMIICENCHDITKSGTYLNYNNM